MTEFSGPRDLQCGATVDQRPTAPPMMLFSSISVDGERKGNRFSKAPPGKRLATGVNEIHAVPYRPRPAHDRREQSETWHLLLRRDGETVPLRLTEEHDRGPHEPTPREQAATAQGRPVPG